MNRPAKYLLFFTGAAAAGFAAGLALELLLTRQARAAIAASDNHTHPLLRAMLDQDWERGDQLEIVGNEGLFALPGNAKLRTRLVDGTYVVVGFIGADSTQIDEAALPEALKAPGLSKEDILGILQTQGLLQ